MCTGIPGRVVSIDRGAAVVDQGGVDRRVSLAVLSVDGDPVRPGDWVLVHAGLALERLSERDAVELARLLGPARP